MNTLINMSEYEKIIFVNGINENQSNVNVTELSHDYPFVVFFTNNDQASSDLEYPVANIWKGVKINNQIVGTRLTRFVGIDKSNNSINLGNGHLIRLLFDYNTGLIGLYEDNKLLLISLIEVSYTNLNGNLEQTNSPAIINAIDNKFNLVFKFLAVGDVEAITNVLNVINDRGHFSLISKNKKGSKRVEGTDRTSISNEYYYKIVEDTYKNNNLISYTFKSLFTSEDTPELCPIANLSLILNPISFDVIHNGLKLGSTITTINSNSTAILDVNLSPIEVDSYAKRRLYVRLDLGSNEYVKFANNTSLLSQYSEVHNGHAIFNIKTEDIHNITVSTGLIFSVYHNEDPTSSGYGQRYGNYLVQNKTLVLKGNDIDTFWYAGYDNPQSSNFDINKLMNFDPTNAGVTILYDFHDSNKNLNLQDKIGGYFYIAIPYNWRGTIYPRWDGYTLNDNGQKIYGDFRSGFNIITDYCQINNIRFVIYKSKFGGSEYSPLFHGKIQ